MRTPAIESERLSLRRLRRGDDPSVISISVYDGRFAATLRQARAIRRRISRDVRRGSSLHWAIQLRDSGVVVGTCGFYRGFADAAGEVGYILRSEYRGHGYMTEAVAAIVRHGFESLGLVRIFARTSPSNATSVAVLERVGFRLSEERGDELVFEISSE